MIEECKNCKHCTRVCADTKNLYWNSYYCEQWKQYMGTDEMICNAFETKEDN